jgi:sn-glycerol 3-phosphate transport system ATP-binding protein
MVYVTHDQAEAMSMADRVVLLRDGRIEQNGAPEDIYQRPASTFVARFIGTPPMNIIELDRQGDGTAIEGLDHLYMLDRPGEDLSLGVRPEDIEISDGAGVRAIVCSLEYLGADSIVDCRIGEQMISVRTHGRIKIEPGTQVNLAWSLENAHYFQSSTGQRRDDLRPNGSR